MIGKAFDFDVELNVVFRREPENFVERGDASAWYRLLFGEAGILLRAAIVFA